VLPLISAERLKWRRTFIPRLVWIAPLFTVMLFYLLMGRQYFQSGAFNGWYTLTLPGALTLVCSLAIQKEAKMKYRALLALPLKPETLWSAKIAAIAGWLLLSTLLFFIGVSLGGWLFGLAIPFTGSAIASLLIFVTFLWQIPLCLLLTSRLGLFAAVLLHIALTVIGVVTFNIGGLWNVMPYTITPRLMCPVLHIMPNGLPVPEGSPLRNTDTILLDVLLSLGWFGMLFFLTGQGFRKQEAR
jgi:lantibiotic transport system permease protein